MRSLFITLEGVNKVGKTTQVKLFSDYLSGLGYRVLTAREPGSTIVGEAIRNILLLPDYHLEPLSQLLLFNTSRVELIKKVVEPVLRDKDGVVIFDRYYDSSYVFQSMAGVPKETILAMNTLLGLPKPDLTLLFDMDVQKLLSRGKQDPSTDRFETNEIAKIQQQRDLFLECAELFPDRISIINAFGSEMVVHRRIVKAFQSLLVKEGIRRK